MEQCEWNFGPSSVVMGKDMGGIREMLTQLMSQLNPQGKSIIPLGHDDPSQFECYRPAKVVEDALVEAILSHKYNCYAPGNGLPDSRRAVAEHLSPGLPYKLFEDDVYLTAGFRQTMETIFAVLSRKDANILLPRPSYPLYDVLLAYNDIQARHYNLIPERDWEVDLDQVEAIADSNTVAIVLSNPNNPCGAVFSHGHLAKLAETAKRLGLLIISDEAYSPMVFGNKPFAPMGLFATVVPVVTLGSISNRWLVPGWQLGWIVTCDPHGILKDTQIKEAIGKLLNLVCDPATIAQGALPDILKNTPQEFYGQTLQMLAHAAEICYNRLQKIIVLNCQFKPQGSLFLMVKINTNGFEDINDDFGFCTKLAKEESVIILPGSCLGMKNWIRICFAVPPSLLEEAFDRIESFCQRHTKST
ncbi:nicotianamine aminotransferase 1 isoform X2 [Cryptomeria japonica]|nr:nicotianamine aminotransferase 1 isoform X2 [Cryptomeria japonica]